VADWAKALPTRPEAPVRRIFMGAEKGKAGWIRSRSLPVQIGVRSENENENENE
jgi:hypothetical protein